MLKRIVILLLVTLFVAPSLFADRRKYVWTYQFATIAPGAAEMEFYQTTKISETDSWEYRIEIEHGLSPRWDLSVYQVFAQKQDEDFKWDAFQIRTRYKLAEAGKYFLDPLLYLEYRRKIDLSAQNKFEGKLILGRDFDRVNLAINPVYEFFWAPGDPLHELGLDLGLSYELSYKLSVGVESSSRSKFIDGLGDTQSSYLGPTISLATGSMYYTFGYTWGLTNDSDDARARFLMGVDL